MRTRTRRKRVARALVAAAATAAVSLASPAASYAAGTPSASSGADGGKPSQARLDKLDKIAKKHDALGVFGDSAPVISLPADASAADKAKVVAEIPAGEKVTVKVSRFTQKQLRKMGKDIGTGPWNKGKYSVGASYDGATDKLIIDTDAPASVTPALTDAYGDKITVRRARIVPQSNRYDDHEWFSGGAALTDGGGICTSGFAVDNVLNMDNMQRTNMMTTAGHCFFRDALVQNRHWDWSHGNQMGWIKRTDWALDVQGFVGYRYDNRIWTGNNPFDPFSNQSLQVRGEHAVWLNRQVCVSGATSLRHCGHPIKNENYGFSWKDRAGVHHWNYDEDGFTYAPGSNWPAYNNGMHTEGGDSGAPIYVEDGTGGAYAIGTHSSLLTWWDGPCGCTNYRMIGVKISKTLYYWGARLRTW